jgi:3-oxoacyl-[acyl-carrier-protein] synthase II
MKKNVVITGMGIVSSIGFDKKSFWDCISEGKSAIKPITGFKTSEFKSHTGAEVVGFDARSYINRRIIKNLDKICCFAIAASRLAFKDADLKTDESNNTYTGIVLGSMYGGWISIAEFHRQMLEYKLKRVDPLLFPNTVPNSAASQIAIEFGLKGPNTSLGSGFASGNDAIGWGLDYLRRERATTMLCGGAEELSYWLMGSFDKLGFLSKVTDKNKEVFKPFDKYRNGLVLGEGAAILILETQKEAQKRGARIYGHLIGYGCAYSDPNTTTGLERSISLALEDAKITPQEIDYINAEGNALIDSDKIESYALKKVFGKYINRLSISSVKPVLGHSLGASGAFDAITCILAMHNNTVPPTINYEIPDPKCDLNYTPNRKIKKEINIAASISFNTNGNCSCLIFKKQI